MSPATLLQQHKRKEARMVRARAREIMMNNGTADQRRQRFLSFVRSLPAEMKVQAGLELVALCNELIAAKERN
jgi:hypothetical protein